MPLEENYLEHLENLGFKIHTRIRWLNAVSGYAPSEVLEQITALPFVQSVEPVHIWRASLPEVVPAPTLNLQKITPFDSIIVDYGLAGPQIKFHNIEQLHHKGLNGKGVIVAVFDTGFLLDHPALQNVRDSLIAQYDFIQQDTVTANQPGDALNQHNHGTYTLSILGSYWPGQMVGVAFGARFILAKTEKVDEEINLEEDNWAAAAQWAEGLGADIVSSSLGYSVFDPGQHSYTYEDMDGETTIVTRAANFLAQRGVLVVNSAGNEGDTSWKHIIAPADGKQVLAVGALDRSNKVASFSSHGFTSDGRIKPDVAALGVGVWGAWPPDALASASGTSASCPLVAGIAAQIYQAFPHLNLGQMFAVIRNAGDNFQNPDTLRGWGKVNALTAWLLANNQSVFPPEEFQVLNPWPNPFTNTSGDLIFPVELPQPYPIRIGIYTILGQKITDIHYFGYQTRNLIRWDGKRRDGTPVASGIYIYRVRAGSFEKSGKVVIVR
ncbi:MAG: S8 family serine peptidase [Calditrichia bacterium]